MKLISIFLMLIAFSVGAMTKRPDVVYGKDNRQDFYEVTNENFKKLSESTAAMVSTRNVQKTQDGFTITGPTMLERGMCPSEKFSSQVTAASCSGFLIGKDIIATAGHCSQSQSECETYYWVFDYKHVQPSSGSVKVKSTDVYKCKKLIKSVLNSGDKNDYSIIQLDRLTNRKPLAFRGTGTVEEGANVVVMGHPTGLPLKIADGAKVRNLNETHFVTNLDTYGGNSGSAVFNADTGLVEGVLVRGETDFVRSSSGCLITNKCDEDGCRGEDVTYSKFLSETFKKNKK